MNTTWTFHIRDLQQPRRFTDIGQKAHNLQWLIRHKWPVPPAIVLPYAVFQAYQGASAGLRLPIQACLRPHIQADRAYAVRSSASLEDSQHHSYAGQFCTYLDLRGPDAITSAVLDVLEAARSPALDAYANRSGQDLGRLDLAVIIQEMATPVVSGVAFSKNPLTGLDETIVEAVQGPGEALVQEGHTPLRWVNKWGTWIDRPSTAPVDLPIIEQVVAHTRSIARQYDAPVDLEWVYDGRQIQWVQLRPITSLDAINIYSNRISREVFPGLIKPLVWSVNVPLVNGAWIELLTELAGPNDLQPEDLARSFAHRAYFNMGALGRIFQLLGLPRESLELLLGLEGGDQNRPRFRPGRTTIPLIPRMLAFARRSLALGPGILAALDDIRRECQRLQADGLETLTAAELLARTRLLFDINRKAARFNIIVPLLLNAYFSLLRRQLHQVGINIDTLDLTRGLPGLERYDPKPHLTRLAGSYNRLDPAVQAAITTGSQAGSAGLPDLQPFQAEVAQFLAEFGYMSDRGNDFSAAPWRETPELVMQMIAHQGRLMDPQPDPASPPSGASARDRLEAGRETRLAWDALPLHPLRRLLTRPVYRRARQFSLYRDAVSATYTYSYGLFRPFFLQLGRCFQTQGLLDRPEDIFFLTWDEIQALVEPASPHPPLVGVSPPAEVVARRRAELDASQDITLPEIIYGDETPPAIQPGHSSNILKGIPGSRGYYRGPVKVIRSVAEFDRLASGDVLVIPFSDVSWTPLFTRAGAVIAESGGMLSHSAIVAREYQIPAVVSVPGAMHLVDHLQVTVDGYRGEVVVHRI